MKIWFLNSPDIIRRKGGAERPGIKLGTKYCSQTIFSVLSQNKPQMSVGHEHKPTWVFWREHPSKNSWTKLFLFGWVVSWGKRKSSSNAFMTFAYWILERELLKPQYVKGRSASAWPSYAPSLSKPLLTPLRLGFHADVFVLCLFKTVFTWFGGVSLKFSIIIPGIFDWQQILGIYISEAIGLILLVGTSRTSHGRRSSFLPLNKAVFLWSALLEKSLRCYLESKMFLL